MHTGAQNKIQGPEYSLPKQGILVKLNMLLG